MNSSSKSLKQIGFLSPAIESAKKFLMASWLYALGDKRLILINPTVTKPGFYLSACVVLAIVILQVVWPDDPISTFELSGIFGRLKPIFGILPPVLIVALLAYSVLWSLPLALMSKALGKKLRWYRIISALCYSFGFWLLIGVSLGTAYIVLLNAMSLDYSTRGWFLELVSSGILLAIFVFSIFRMYYFFGIAYGVHGGKLFFLYSIFVTVPLVVLDMLVVGLHPISASQRYLKFPPFSSHYIPSEAMEPTLSKGALILTNHTISAHSITRGDVITFDRGGAVFVARVLGLPEDTVEFKDGVPWINNREVDQSKIGSYSLERDPDATLLLEKVSEKRSYSVLDLRNTRLDYFPQTPVPKGEFFVVGDNRDNSFDSRTEQFGRVGFEDYLAKVYFVLLPMEAGYLYKE